MSDLTDRVEYNLTNHTPGPEQIEQIEHLREAAKRLGFAIVNACPAGREQSIALTALEETTMWAVAAIARAPS